MAQATKSVSPTVVAQVFEEFIAQHGVPKQLDSDGGEEYNNARFQEVLKRLKVGHIVGSTKDKNKLAVVDRAIATLKRAILPGKGEWVDKVESAVKGYNNAPQSHNLDVPPSKVEENKEVVFHLYKEAAKDMQQHDNAIQKRQAKLEKTGTFRPETEYKGFRRRAGDPTHGGEAHTVAGFKGASVVDTKGREYPTKLVAPVAAGSESVAEKPVGGERAEDREAETTHEAFCG